MNHIELLIGAVLALIGAGGLRWLLGKHFRAGTPKGDERRPVPPAPQHSTVSNPDERQTPKPPRTDPADHPHDDPAAVDQLSAWGDELLDE